MTPRISTIGASIRKMSSGIGGSGDIYWNNVVLAMHMDDVGLSDLKGHAVTLKGDAARSAVKSMFGGYSACFDGSGDYLTVANSSDYDLFGASTNSTIEFFAWFGSTANTPHVLIVGTSEAYRATLFLRSGILVLWTKTNNTNHGDRITGPSIATGRWYHIAVCNAAGILKLFVDGVSYGTSNTTVVPTGALGVALGWQLYGGVAADYLNGYIDDLRITKGVARYTANFTPPSQPFPENYE